MPDITISLTAEQAQLLANALGKLRGLKNQDGTQRAATLAEMKHETISHYKNIVGDDRRSAARAAVTVAEFD